MKEKNMILFMRASLIFPASKCILTLFFLVFLKADDAFACSSSDLRALRDLTQNLDANSGDCCSWKGVYCGTTLNARNLTTMRVVGLNFSGMGLQGVLTSSISGLDELTFLNISKNSFSGNISPELFHLKLLELLDLGSNQFSGELPPGIGNLSSLRRFDVSRNNLAGMIPDAFQTLQNLESILGESSGFVGELPASLSSCSKLTTLSFWNNSLEGNIDRYNFSRLVLLTSLNLGWNKLQGHIPGSLSACKKLNILSLTGNELSGQIPEQFCSLAGLHFLDLNTNYLSNLPESLRVLQNCPNLSILRLSVNFRGEELPTGGIQGFRQIRILALGKCGLTGSIPPWLRNCSELRILDLSSNHLRGEIPPWIGNLDHLFVLLLSNNSLSGEIPVAVTELKSLRSGVQPEDSNFCCAPPFYFWDEGDQINTARSFKLCTNFAPTLYLSMNTLNGPIWKEFGSLKYLHKLDLSWNNLSGPIPGDLANMENIDELILSYNDLTGSIPSSFTRLHFLSSFDVSYNHLEGAIPRGGQFFSFPCSSFEGNPGLYSDSLPSCNSSMNATDLPEESDDGDGGFVLIGLPFAVGVIVSFLPTVYVLIFRWDQNYYYN